MPCQAWRSQPPASSCCATARSGLRLTCCTATRACPSHPPQSCSRADGSTRPITMVLIRSVPIQSGAVRSGRQQRRPALYWLRLIFIRGRTGLLRRSSRVAMTPGSSWQSCLLILRLQTFPAKPSVRNGRLRGRRLAAERSGVIRLMPPTMSILIELADLGSVEAVIKHAKDRQIEEVLPKVVETPQGWQFRYPRVAAGSS